MLLCDFTGIILSLTLLVTVFFMVENALSFIFFIGSKNSTSEFSVKRDVINSSIASIPFSFAFRRSSLLSNILSRNHTILNTDEATSIEQGLMNTFVATSKIAWTALSSFWIRLGVTLKEESNVEETFARRQIREI